LQQLGPCCSDQASKRIQQAAVLHHYSRPASFRPMLPGVVTMCRACASQPSQKWCSRLVTADCQPILSALAHLEFLEISTNANAEARACPPMHIISSLGPHLRSIIILFPVPAWLLHAVGLSHITGRTEVAASRVAAAQALLSLLLCIWSSIYLRFAGY
jgi:hypothetical protein